MSTAGGRAGVAEPVCRGATLEVVTSAPHPFEPDRDRIDLPRPRDLGSASFVRRTVAAVVDWVACNLITIGLIGVDPASGGAAAFVPLLVFVAENILLVSTAGSTLGHRLLGLRVRALDGGPAGPARATIRTALLALFLPAVLTGADGRGLHDRTAGTLIVRT